MVPPLDLPLDPLPLRPVLPPTCVAPVEAGAEGGLSREFCDAAVPIPERLLPLPFADYLHRQNIIWRLTRPEGAVWPERGEHGSGERGPARRAGDRAVAAPGPGGWPRLGDAPPAHARIDRRVEVAYRVEIQQSLGTRLDLVG